MLRKRRTGILVKGDPLLAKTLAEQISKNYPIKMMQQPNSGLVMVKMRESSQRKLFYLGEVLVTECKVQINGVLGIGVVQDFQPELAHYLAVIDSAYNAELPEAKAWDILLIQEERRIAEREDQELNRVLKTRVNFETMII